MADKTSEAQKKASRAWEQKNPERAKHMRYKSNAKTFVRKHASEAELQELETLIEERRKALNAAQKNITSDSKSQGFFSVYLPILTGKSLDNAKS